MIPNHSPWIKQLNRTRPVVPLDTNITTDVAIVGGGIAGVASAFFTLRDTDKKVVLVEADKIAHGATGHNAGLLASYIERPFGSMVQEFGLEQAIKGQKDLDSGWMLLDEIYTSAGLRTPLYKFIGYEGCLDLEQAMVHLEENKFRMQGGLALESFLVAKDSLLAGEIPAEHRDLYELVAHEDLLALLETHNHQYVAALAYQSGCMNSALFTEELVGYMIATYPDRFSFYEGSPVRHVALSGNSGMLSVGHYTVQANRIVLCTNGFENFTISNEGGSPINSEFHHLIAGRIGYMAGYIEPLSSPPTVISYSPRMDSRTPDPTGESYFYLTRRPHEHQQKESHNLVCMGGPEKVLPNGALYSRDESCDEDMRMMIDDFLRQNYRNYPSDRADYAYCWHGLMGYTPNGIRRIGVEPCNPVLLYNLGCNGVGIIPSIFGGRRIAQILSGAVLEPSLFDPVDQREGVAQFPLSV